MVRLYVEEKLSIGETGRRLFWSATAVRNTLIRNGAPIRSRGGTPYTHWQALSQEDIDRVVELYGRGFSTVTIGRRLGLHPTSVRHRLQAAGVPRRSRSAAIQLLRCEHVCEGWLSELQRRALHELDKAVPERRTTVEVARALEVKIPTAYAALQDLKRFGLATSKRTVGGTSRVWDDGRCARGRVIAWLRTSLPVREVLWQHVCGLKNKDRTEWLPIGPFRDWLQRLIDEQERIAKHAAVTGSQGNGDGSQGIPTTGVVARRLGLDERRVWAYLHENEFVALRVVDAALARSGDGTRLQDLWPVLGTLEDLTGKLPRSPERSVAA